METFGAARLPAGSRTPMSAVYAAALRRTVKSKSKQDIRFKARLSFPFARYIVAIFNGAHKQIHCFSKTQLIMISQHHGSYWMLSNLRNGHQIAHDRGVFRIV